MANAAPLTERSRRTRAELGRAVHACLAASGSLDVDTVVDTAGVSAATFYSHFASHDDALAGALEVSLRRIVDVCIDEFHLETLVEHGLDEVVSRLVAGSHEAFRSESLVLRAALARLSHHRGIREVYRRHEARGHDHLTRQIELGQKAGLLGGGPATDRATSLLVMLQGINNPMLTGQKRLTETIRTDLQRAVRALLTGG